MHVAKYQPDVTVPLDEGTVFSVQGAAGETKIVKMHNLDVANTMTYKFQYSDDGSTWTDVATLATLAPEAHTTVLLTAHVFHRLKASGLLTLAVEASAYQDFNDIFSFVNL